MIAAPFEKTYLSRAQSRIWSMDNPVGDPFGGPAYGERNEPVSMIAAVVSIGVGASAVGAAVTAGALTLSAVMGGLMIAGGAASLIGTVSGNKKLAMIGGIVAGVGGLGLGATNLFADAAATTSATAIDAGATSAEQVGSQGFNAYTPEEIATMNQVGEQAVADLNSTNIVPTATDATTASYQAPSAAFDSSTITTPNSAGTVDNSNLATNLLDQSSAGQVANISPNSVNEFADEMANQITMASNNPLQPSPYESLADASGKTPLVERANPFDNGVGSLEGISDAERARLTEIGNYNAQNNWPGAAEQSFAPVKLGDGSSGVTNQFGEVFDSSGKYLGQAPGFENNAAPTVYGNGSQGNGGWLDKIEGIARGIEKYKTTAMLGGNLISGAMKYAIPSQSDQAAIDLYEAKSNLANAEANAINALEERKRRHNESVKNLRPIQLNNSLNPIFGNALNGAGIINSARA